MKQKKTLSFILLSALGALLFLPASTYGKAIYAQESAQSEDLLIFNNGETLAGSFISSDTRSVRFQPENNLERSYPRSQVNTVVLGVLRISTVEGFTPGLPQYKRGQRLKGHFFLTTNLLSFAVASYGLLEWLRLETEISTKERATQQFIDDNNSKQTTASAIGIVGGAAFIFFYAWHIMDWLYWGNNYNAFLSESSSSIKAGKKERGNFRVLFFHRKELAYRENTEDLYEARFSFSF